MHGQAVRISRFENTGLCRVYVQAEDGSGDGACFVGVAELGAEGELSPKRLVNFEEQS